MLIVSALYGARSQEFHSSKHMCCDDVTIKVIWFEDLSAVEQIIKQRWLVIVHVLNRYICDWLQWSMKHSVKSVQGWSMKPITDLSVERVNNDQSAQFNNPLNSTQILAGNGRF